MNRVILHSPHMVLHARRSWLLQLHPHFLEMPFQDTTASRPARRDTTRKHPEKGAQSCSRNSPADADVRPLNRGCRLREEERLKVSEHESRSHVHRAGRERRAQEKSPNGLAGFCGFFGGPANRHGNPEPLSKKVWQGGEVWQRIFDTIQSAGDAHRSQLSASSEQGAFVADRNDRLHSFAAKGHPCQCWK